MILVIAITILGVAALVFRVFVFKKIVLNQPSKQIEPLSESKKAENEAAVDDYISFTNKVFGVVIIPGVLLGTGFMYYMTSEIVDSGSSLIDFPSWLKFIPLLFGSIVLAQVISRMYFEKTRVTCLWHSKEHGRTGWTYLIYVYGIIPALLYKRKFL